ncbi:hypothetical protein DRQ33_04580 [bacterium]|nr:MAG: hypothetical protein DRQ33_04580 [bacterium]
MNYLTKRKLTYTLVAIPALGFLTLQIIPLIYAGITAITDAQGNFSLHNILFVLGDKLFLQGLKYNIIIPISSVVLEAFIGVAMAIWFYYLRRKKTFWRTVAIIPFAVPQIVYLLTMKLVFRQHGYLNSLLYNLGGADWIVNWFRPGSILSMIVIIFVDAWRVTPIVFLIVLAALEQMPESYIQAARVDGASLWQVIRHIQIPLVIPALLVALSLRAVDAFRIFATPFVLMGVQGMPVLTSVAYHYKIDANNPAAANTTALILAGGLFIATALTLFLSRKRNRI